MRASIFEFTDYKIYLREWVANAPEGSRGWFSRLAEAAVIHKTSFSQIVRGEKDLTLEQALRISQFMNHSESETAYFILLVERQRAGSHELKLLFTRQINDRRRKNSQLVERVTRSREMSSEERAIYYSHWIYAAVRNLSAIEGFQSRERIAETLRLSARTLTPVLEFLLQTGLCVETSQGLGPGPAMTHLEADSPLVSRHHSNWRIKAMERHPSLREDELAYSAPMTLSARDVKRVRALLATVVETVDEIVGPSASEKLYCLNLDWFEIQ